MRQDPFFQVHRDLAYGIFVGVLILSPDLAKSGFFEAQREVLKKYKKILLLELIKGHFLCVLVSGKNVTVVDSGAMYGLQKARGEYRFNFAARPKSANKTDFKKLKR